MSEADSGEVEVAEERRSTKKRETDRKENGKPARLRINLFDCSSAARTPAHNFLVHIFLRIDRLMIACRQNSLRFKKIQRNQLNSTEF